MCLRTQTTGTHTKTQTRCLQYPPHASSVRDFCALSIMCGEEEKLFSVSFLPAGFQRENHQESPPRERLESRAPQETSSQEGPPDKCPAYVHGSRTQSSRKWEQGPEGTQDDTTREGEVSGSIAQGEALRSSLAAPRSNHLPTLLMSGEGFGAGHPQPAVEVDSQLSTCPCP